MRSVNMLVLVGNVGNDPEVRSTTGGTRVATLSLATTAQWGKGEEKHEKTEWHRVILWSGLAEVAEKHIKKGDRLYIQGRVEYRQWQDKDGQTRYSTEVVAEELVMLGSPRGGSGRRPERDDFDGDAYDEPPHDDRESAGAFFDRKADEAKGRGGNTRPAAKKSPAKKR